jgi:signal peptidase II
MTFYITKKKTFLFLLLITISILLDQITKLAVTNNFNYLHDYYIVTPFLNIVYVINNGISFGILAKDGISHAFLGMLAVATVIFIIYWLVTTKELNVQIALSFVIGGAIGNIIDRFRIKGVIDFIDLHINNYHWPAFNVADSFIVIGLLYVTYIIMNTKGESK